MATTSVSVDETPTAIAGLSDGSSYTIQNRSVTEVFIASAAAAPDVASTDAKILRRYPEILSVGRVTKESSEDLYVWVETGRSGTVSIDEVG